MKTIINLSIKYFIKNKKRSLITIVAIMIATILITAVLSIFASFRQYMVNLQRNDKNWEAEFIDIRYSDAKEIEKDYNIKETSLYYDLGESEITDSPLGGKINLRAYSDNALKNANLHIIEGRLPQNTNEIIISEYLRDSINRDIGSKLENNFNGVKKEYRIVGVVEDLEEDSRTVGNIRYGAITYLETNTITDDTIMNVRILANNVNKIKNTTEKLVKELKLYELKNKEEKVVLPKEDDLELWNIIKELTEKEIEKSDEEISKGKENSNEKVIYNTNLLRYELVTNIDKSFAIILFISGGILTFIISIATIIIIYTSFKMSYHNRIKDIGVLSSIRYEQKTKK